MPVSLVKKRLTLEKSKIFLMLDSETVFNSNKRAYELAFVVFDSLTCKILHKVRYLVRETLMTIGYYKLKRDEWPIYWPSSRLDLFDCLSSSDCLPLADIMASLSSIIKDYDISALIAHNIQFDLSAIYGTCVKYGDIDSALSLLMDLPKLELSGFFIHGLPEGMAENMPHKQKSGCMTFKADHLCPSLLGTSQNHNALEDCQNQISLYKIALENSGVYVNRGTIYANMVEFHKVQYENARFLGNSTLE